MNLGVTEQSRARETAPGSRRHRLRTYTCHLVLRGVSPDVVVLSGQSESCHTVVVALCGPCTAPKIYSRYTIR